MTFWQFLLWLVLVYALYYVCVIGFQLLKMRYFLSSKKHDEIEFLVEEENLSSYEEAENDIFMETENDEPVLTTSYEQSVEQQSSELNEDLENKNMQEQYADSQFENEQKASEVIETVKQMSYVDALRKAQLEENMFSNVKDVDELYKHKGIEEKALDILNAIYDDRT